jgi:hypothetical protein
MGFDGLSWNVLLAAASVAVLHTALGIDHTLPFVMLARARGWSRRRTLWITALCGTGHVVCSLALAVAGALLGAAFGVLEGIEQSRGQLAAWILVGFGGAYALWGARRAWCARRELVLHDHAGDVHAHARGGRPHAHAHPVRADASFWALFCVFLFGPCEPLIPLVFLPVSQGRWSLALGVFAVFSIATLATMLALVAGAHATARRLRLGALEPWSHSLAGTVIAASGFGVLFAGL